jgi:hypothetical protein
VDRTEVHTATTATTTTEAGETLGLIIARDLLMVVLMAGLREKE